jgi:hypothetical protein
LWRFAVDGCALVIESLVGAAPGRAARGGFASLANGRGADFRAPALGHSAAIASIAGGSGVSLAAMGLASIATPYSDSSIPISA